MARKQNGRKRRPNGNTNGARNFLTYTDLVNSRIETAAAQADYTYTAQQLLPGLSVTAVGGRVIVPKRVDIEIIPQYLNATVAPPTTAVIQAQVPATWAGNRSSESFGSMKWKLISAVNPTRLSLSFDSLSNYVPYVKRPTSLVDNEELLNLKIESGVSGQGIELFLVIKTLVRVMPQDALIGPTPTVSVPRSLLAADKTADPTSQNGPLTAHIGEPIKYPIVKDTSPTVAAVPDPEWPTAYR